MGDTAIMWVIIAFFTILGTVLPFVQQEFTGTATSHNASEISTELEAEVRDLDSTSVFKVLFSIAKMFFWTFGDLFWLVDLIIFVPMRIILLWLLVRAARGI